MINFNNRTVRNYILGLDVSPFKVEDLENDVYFMREVLMSSKDYRMYDFASKRVKEDYRFVSLAISLFKSNIPFIKKVATNYLESTDDKVTTLEVSIILSEILPDDDPDYLTYVSKRLGTTLASEFDVALVKRELEKNPLIKDQIGMGFMILRDEYEGSTIILDFFAKNMIVRIFKENDLDIEVLLHRRFKTVKDFLKVGIINYLVALISSFDKDLGEYAAVHKNVIDEYVHLVNIVIGRWDQYLSDLEKNRYAIMSERLMAFFEEDEFHSRYSFDDMVELVGRELGILDKLKLYKIVLPISEELEEYIDFDDDSSYESQPKHQDTEIEEAEEEIDKSNFDVADYAYYMAIKNIMLEVLKMPVDTDDSYDDYVEKEQKKQVMDGKVIEFAPKGKKRKG